MVETETAPIVKEKVPTLPLLPLKNVVILPKSIIPIIVGRPQSVKAVEIALNGDRSLFITAQKDSSIESPELDDLYDYGTRATILEVMRTPNGGLKILAEGVCRAQMHSHVDNDGYATVTYEDIISTPESSIDLIAQWRQLRSLYHTYTKLNDKAPADLTDNVDTPQDMDYATDTIAVRINNLTIQERQQILECSELIVRMNRLSAFLHREIEILQAEQRIRGRIQTQVEKNQREYYLTEQIKAIQKELGREDQATEIEQIRVKVKTIGLTKEALEKVEKELHRLEQMPPLSSEAVVSRHYIDWIISLPWRTTSKDTIGIKQAERILNKSHAGLKKPKERIAEFLAAKKFSKNLERSPIICLVGPPGVGKTSLGKSVAQSLGREFVRISLGGIRDEAEIRGHRRTYVGSLPGKIIQAMKKARTMNPVILLDEIDKMSQDIHGDPAAALLEVLDPEQNKTFVDHFLDIEYDLSKVMFITTANVLDNIPYALFDRLEIIGLSGYTQEEKCDITKQFLIPKNLSEYGLTKKQCIISDDIVRSVIDDYTREAGVRHLERLIAKLMRKAIQAILQKPTTKSIRVTKPLLLEWLGFPTCKKTSLNQTNERVGLATGLAWTEVGGDVMEIETSVLPGKGGMMLTGQLGEVMQESAQAALSYIRSRAKDIGLKSSFHTTKDIHLHIPEGATPKDGPSAGITICVALISALTKKQARRDVAMTGEVTLQGRVLSIGGLKEKLLAAKQHDFKTVIVPHENFDDVEEIRKEINLDGLKIVYAKIVDDVLGHAFAKSPFMAKKAIKRKPSAQKRKIA